MDNYSGWEGYYNSNNSKAIWKDDIDPFLLDNSEFLIPNNSRAKILDIACGDGRNTAFFAGHGNIVCVDISKTALLKLGNKFPDTIRICEDFTNTVLMNEQFDIVICFDGLAQMENPDSALTKMVDMTKEDGVIIFNLFTLNDCAYGEGDKINESTFNYKNTLFKFYSFEQAKGMIPKGVSVLKEEIRSWNDPPHGDFRPYPHRHEASFFVLKKYKL